jgi:hypothetical protein
MAIIDSVTQEDLQKLKDILDAPAEKTGKGKKFRALCEKYKVNDWYFYKNRDKIESLLKGIVPAQPTVTGTSTLLDDEGNVRLQWVKEKANDKASAVETAITEIIGGIESRYTPIKKEAHHTFDDKLAVYISNDVHLGALMWAEETLDRDWDADTSERVFKDAIDNLVARAPATEECIVADLGDLTEMDDLKSMTPKSGHVLDVDGRYPKILKLAMDCMVYFVERALEKHDTVHFYNISGNHDITTGYAIASFVSAWFKNEPRVHVDESPAKQKYFQFGSTLIGFAHGDGLKMRESGEVMAMHNAKNWGTTANRYFHFGHVHKDMVYDGRLCKSESHRNLAPLNAWAADNGFGRNAGTMKALIYDKKRGEDLRITYNVEAN